MSLKTTFWGQPEHLESGNVKQPMVLEEAGTKVSSVKRRSNDREYADLATLGGGEGGLWAQGFG